MGEACDVSSALSAITSSATSAYVHMWAFGVEWRCKGMVIEEKLRAAWLFLRYHIHTPQTFVHSPAV